MALFIVLGIIAWLAIGFWVGFFAHKYWEEDYTLDMMVLSSMVGPLNFLAITLVIIQTHIQTAGIKIKFSKRK